MYTQQTKNNYRNVVLFKCSDKCFPLCHELCIAPYVNNHSIYLETHCKPGAGN